MKADDGYRLLAGKCKTYCEAIIAVDPSWTLVRGHYFDALWNQDRAHWWLKSADGVIFDPTREQFPTRGSGEYTEFDGTVECCNCAKTMQEADAISLGSGNYMACSDRCACRFVGIEL